ncbi:MAG: transcription termination factor NusA [Candidatus Omnitrophica bacterium]|nr:transcription termination factor NusA [Candidatus Omnitrophota bacterium]
MNGELLTALERIEREKGISKEILFEAIESALASAARKVIDDPELSKEDIEVTIDKETGEIRVFSIDGEIENERFGRIAAQTAKQVIIQKIREAERDVISGKYLKKVGSIISGSVHRFEKGNIVVELDDAEAIVPKQEQIPREKFRQGELIRAYLVKVERGNSGPEIILSRTAPGFVKKLFELEVPEIAQGIVEIKGIAREAGERTKMAVCSKDDKIDPVGACVGMRGSRVRDIVKELHGERIDIVHWDEDIREYLPAAVNPAEISRMLIDRENKRVTLTVPKDQLSLLIGKKGRNIRLASKLLGWELIAEAAHEPSGILISEVAGIGLKTKEVLVEAGYSTPDKVALSSVEELSALKGVGEKSAEKMISVCKKLLNETRAAREKAKEEETAVKKEEEAAKKFFAPSAEEESEPKADGNAVEEKSEPEADGNAAKEEKEEPIKEDEE